MSRAWVVRCLAAASVAAMAWTAALADSSPSQPKDRDRGSESAASGTGGAGESSPGTSAEPPEFRLNLDDIMNLEESDIVLPELDELLKKQPASKPDAADQQTPEAETGDEDEGPDIDPAEVVERIKTHMGEAAQRLVERQDPGDGTIEVEKKAIDDLGELIEYVKQQQAQQQQQQQQQQQRQSSQDSQQQRRRRQQQQQRQQQQTGRQRPRQGNQPMQQEQATKGQVEEGALDEVSDLLMERWGDLLPNRPRETMQSIRGMILQEYVDLLDRYYYALAGNRSEAQEEE